MASAFARVGQALAGALGIAQNLFDGIPTSFQFILSAGAVLMVVKYFIAPIVGPSTILGGASDQVSKSLKVKANTRNKQREKERSGK